MDIQCVALCVHCDFACGDRACVFEVVRCERSFAFADIDEFENSTAGEIGIAMELIVVACLMLCVVLSVECDRECDHS